MHVLCLDTREPRETQTQNSSQPELKTKSSERLGVDTGEHQRDPNPEQSTVYSHLRSVCGQEVTPEKPRPRSSPQPAVMSVKGKTEMLTEGGGDWGRERGL